MTTETLAFDLVLTGGVYLIPIIVLLVALIAARHRRRRVGVGGRARRAREAHRPIAESSERA